MDTRYVKFENGLNFVKGASKTGKSALLEIMDYCLCSKSCTVPKGTIRDFAKYYSIILTIYGIRYIIIREKPDNGGKMIFQKVNDSFEPNDITAELVSSFKFKPVGQIKREIEFTFGIDVQNFITDGDKTRRASLRNMASYLFQHQNLIASKFALFYRFNDIYKRKDALEQFPIFAGILNQSFYSLVTEKNSIEAKIKTYTKAKKNAEKSELLVYQRLRPLLEDYYSLIGFDCPDISNFKDLIKKCKCLPIIDNEKYIGDYSVFARIKELKNRYYELQDNERRINLLISSLEETNNNGKRFIDSIESIYSKASFRLFPKSGKIKKCPLCSQNVNEKSDLLDCVVEEIAQEKTNYKIEYEKFPEERRLLDKQLNDVVSEIKRVYGQIKQLQKECFRNVEQKDKIETVKNKIELYVDLLENNTFNLDDSDELALSKKLSEINSKLAEFDYENKMKDALKYINENMNRIANKLDFEDEYKPVELFFSINGSDYEFYLKNGEEKVQLEEMGSAANWISCHLALFLALIRYFCKEEKSCILKTLFLDQPSQVYFATDTNQYDLEPVKSMYQVIKEEIDDIVDKTKVRPQVIIVDHADFDEFEEYVRATWYNGEAFI